MSQATLKYSATDPEGAWRLLRDNVTAAEADFVATQARPPDDLVLGTPPPGPADFQGIRFFMACYADAAPKTIIPGGSWDAQAIEVGILPPLVPPKNSDDQIVVLGSEVISTIAGLEVVTLGGWRDGVISIRLAALTLAGGADFARVYVREF